MKHTKLPQMLEDIFGWNDWYGVGRDNATVEQIIEWGNEIIGIVTYDYWTYITNDEDGFTDEQFKEVKEYIKNLESPPCNIAWANKFIVGDCDTATLSELYEFFIENIADDEEFIDTYNAYVALGETNTPFDLSLLQAVSSGDIVEVEVLDDYSDHRDNTKED